MSLKVGVVGAAGRMGATVCNAVHSDDDLELVARRMPVSKLEGIKSDSRPEQMDTEMEFVEFSCAISKTHRFELGVFESFQPI